MIPNSRYYFTFVDKCPVVGQEQVKEVAGRFCYARGCTDYLVEESIFDDCKELGTLSGIGQFPVYWRLDLVGSIYGLFATWTFRG